MRQHGNTPLRICLDVQATQTEGSRHRGVGNYSAALTRTVAADASRHQVTLTANAAYPLDHALLGGGRYRSYDYPPTAGVWGDDPRRLVAERLVEHCWRQINPDVLHVHHLFEGYVGKAVVPEQLPHAASMVTSATLYDLIPLRFAGHYLSDERLASWYRRKLSTLARFDVLLAISESSRRDAIELLGLPASQIITIMGDCDPRYRVLTPDAINAMELRARLGIRRDMILYTGGDDHRKNLSGMLAGFAAMPGGTRETHQLVIVCKLLPERKAVLERQARELGLEPGLDVTFTGYVDDADLVRLYNDCKLFVFPSLYEGFGLPVLEAMRCGAPVIAADNSSLPEIVGNSDALFGTGNAQALAAKLMEVLPDPAALATMREKALLHAGTFSWKESARVAVEAWEEAHERKNSAAASLVAVSRLSKPRIAYFTPLPPTRSGIADYNAVFLPYLARHFEIDVYYGPKDKVPGVYPSGVSSIRPWSEFEARAASYYSVLYEVGNSEFHGHMLEILQRHPGVVGLHDAYLSGLMAYSAFQGGDPAMFYREMVRAHGGRARQMLLPSMAGDEAVNAAVRQMACTRIVFDHATGVISHSPFNAQLAQEDLGHLVRQPYRIVPQMMPPAPHLDEAGRASTRARLGIPAGAFVVATFGHIAWNKMGDSLLRAFLASLAQLGADAMLVFAGQLSDDPFGDGLRSAVSQAALPGNIRITGFLADTDFRDYLCASDVAVQLRIESRGGTPKGVLDGLSCGLPVIVNRYASYTDYPEDVLYWLPEFPAESDISHALVSLRKDPGKRHALAARGRDYVALRHDPSTCAAQYAAAIHDMAARTADAALAIAAQETAGYLALDPGRAEAAPRVARSLLRDVAATGEVRLLIDVSHIAESDHQTGVSRVVRSLVRQAYLSTRPGLDVRAVQMGKRHELQVASRWLESQGLLLPGESPRAIDEWCSDQDVLLMLDASWARYHEFIPAMKQWRDRGGQVVTALYDLIPIRLPECVPAGGDQWFRKWLEMAVRESDGIICISRAVADDLVDYLRTEKIAHRPGLRIGHWMLGGDFTADPSELEQRADSMLVDGRPRRVLMVGTIEPRKQYGLALDAFDRLWAQGSQLQLVIVGKPGWMCDDLIERMRSHPEAGKRLHYLGQADDSVLARQYADCDVLLFPTRAEGFGLPILEAAAHGMPVLANDLPVLREIAEGYATFSRMSDAIEIAQAVLAWYEAAQAGTAPSSAGLSMQSWQESSDQLLRVLVDGNWYLRLD